MRKVFETKGTALTTRELRIDLIKWELAILLETSRQLRLVGRREEYETDRRIEVLRLRLDQMTGEIAGDDGEDYRHHAHNVDDNEEGAIGG